MEIITVAGVSDYIEFDLVKLHEDRSYATVTGCPRRTRPRVFDSCMQHMKIDLLRPSLLNDASNNLLWVDHACMLSRRVHCETQPVDSFAATGGKCQ